MRTFINTILTKNCVVIINTHNAAKHHNLLYNIIKSLKTDLFNIRKLIINKRVIILWEK